MEVGAGREILRALMDKATFHSTPAATCARRTRFFGHFYLNMRDFDWNMRDSEPNISGLILAQSGQNTRVGCAHVSQRPPDNLYITLVAGGWAAAAPGGRLLRAEGLCQVYNYLFIYSSLKAAGVHG